MKIDAESGSPENAPKRILLTDYTPPPFRVTGIDLYFHLHESRTEVRAVQTLECETATPPDTLVLNGSQLRLLEIKIDNEPAPAHSWTADADTLTILHPPGRFTLETRVEINPEQNKSCSGLYLSRGIFATQCEAEGFRNITYFLDRPDVMTSYTVTIDADKKKYPVLLSNGDLISRRDLPAGRHEAVWRDPFKKPSYLFALVAGDLGVVEGDFTTRSGKKIKLEVYASHGKQARCHHALESLKKAMKWDEERFGLEYDLNQYMIVSIDDFNMGAMENKGLNIFNSRLVLADPESATDTDFERIESVVGHEYFHNWTGNRITCRNWFELSLKEGLTVFRDQEFSADLNSRAVQRIKDVDTLRQRQFSEDAGPNAHPVRPESCLAVDNFYTPTIYEKGAEIIRMMQTIVGRAGFRKGMDEYVRRHDGQAVTILDFADAIAQPNGADFSQLKLWYTLAGTPDVFVQENYDPAGRRYTLTLKQQLLPAGSGDRQAGAAKPLHIPLLIGLLDSRGNDLELTCENLAWNSDAQPVLHLREAVQSFIFHDISEKPVLSLNREFSAPVKLHWAASADELLHLIKYDRDAFNRREACFKMTLEELQRLIGDYRNARPLVPAPAILEALGAILADTAIDPQFKALMLQLPDDDILAQAEPVLDARAFRAARLELIRAVVGQFGETLLQQYREHHARTSIGDRALKNRILSYLLQAGHPEAASLAEAQFRNSNNMTDKLGALMGLCLTEAPQKEAALAAFFARWKDDAVVFNKWLQVQAIAPLESTFENVQRLSQTAPYSHENPNNIYALQSAFGDNYLAMQRADGSTFKWLCDEIIRIDKMNPQVAANVCGSFNFIKKYPAELRALAQNEIRRVLNVPDLSRNARELLEGCI